MKKRNSKEQTSDSSTKPTLDELLAKRGIRDVTKENLGKTYITFTHTLKEELATSDDGLIYLAVTGRLASDDFFEDTGFYGIWGNYPVENLILSDAIYLGWGIVKGMQVTGRDDGLVLTDAYDIDSYADVEVYCIERKHIDLIENNFLESGLCHYNPPIPPRVLVTVEPVEANFSTPVKAWAYYVA